MSPEEKQDLLRLAAKALGWVDYPEDSVEPDRFWYQDKAKAPFGPRIAKHAWRPLDDDGDCARMEAALLMKVYLNDGHVSVGHESFGEQQQCEFYGEHGGDRNSARRLASTFVAASIGAAMERDE